MQTNFTFICEKWTDPDSPLTYEFSYENKGTRTIFYYRTAVSGQSVHLMDWLPIGSEENDFKLIVNVHVKDYMGAKAVREFTLKVNGLVFLYGGKDYG